MTMLIAGSMLLIAGSAVALAIGWITASETLIWTSMAASVGTGILLAVAYARSRGEVKAAARQAAATDSQPVASRHAEIADEPAPEPVPAVGVTTPVEKTHPIEETYPIPATKPKKHAPKHSKQTATKKTTVPKSKVSNVVAVADRKKFHKPSCRFANKGEHITRAQAVKKGYTPCGSCKP